MNVEQPLTLAYMCYIPFQPYLSQPIDNPFFLICIPTSFSANYTSPFHLWCPYWTLANPTLEVVSVLVDFQNN